MKGIFMLITGVLSTLGSFAYNYGEHKEIGNQAFLRFLASVPQKEFLSLLNLKGDSSGYYFADLSGDGRAKVSYGILNALSGDHESNPLMLEEQLRQRNSTIERIILLHERYMAMGYAAAPDGKLSKTDYHYALLAAANLSHFYEYKKTFQQQLRYFDKNMIRQLEDPSQVNAIFKKLGKTNAINMYVTLHTLAITLAEQSGALAQTNEINARQLLFYAFLFNGFADHFLEDAFAAGHLIVNRTIFESVTNNKALHDFYSENGCTAVNLKGEIWHAYGDGQFNNTHHSWQKDTSLHSIQYTPYTKEAEMVITAVQLSLADLSDAFRRSYGVSGYTSFIRSVPDEKDRQPLFLIQQIPSLQHIPIPYNSDLKTLFDDPATITPAMLKANQLLPYRNFIKSRVANSVVIGFNKSFFADDYFQGPDIRINAGNFARRFRYNDHGDKKGMLDYWHGYTVSFAVTDLRNTKGLYPRTRAQQARAGIRSNFDYWITRRKFIGIYTYVEAGAQFSQANTSFIFMPSVGIQLASLVNVNYHNMPAWLRIPVQYFLPLKFRYGSQIAPHASPRYFTALDIDILF